MNKKDYLETMEGIDKSDLDEETKKKLKSLFSSIFIREESIMDDVMEDHENRDEPTCLEMINGLDDSEDEQ